MRIRDQFDRITSTWRCNRGSTAVEFARVALPLILIIGAICETGLFLLFQFQIKNATEVAARLIRLNSITQPTAWTKAQFKTELCKHLVIYDCMNKVWIDVRHVPTVSGMPSGYFGLLANTMPSDILTVGPAGSSTSYNETFDPGASGEVGSLIVTYDWRFIFPFMSIPFGNVTGNSQVRRLAGLSVFRNEM